MPKTFGPFNPFKHNAESGGYSDLSKAYKENPSIELYAEMRRNYPKALVEVATSRSMDWLFSNSEMVQGFGIDPQVIAGALDADEESINSLSLSIMENLIHRRRMESIGIPHVLSRDDVMGDSLINYLISMMLDALDWNDWLFIPRDLIVLIKHQIGAEKSVEARKQEVLDNRKNVVFNAARLRAMGKKCSIRDIAKFMDVSPSTVGRWFQGSSFEEEVESYKLFFDENGETEISRLATELFEKKKFKE